MKIRRDRSPICALAQMPCPRNSDPAQGHFCPFWSDGVVWTNQITGEETVENCAARMLIPGMIASIRAANGPAAAIESMRNTIDRVAPRPPKILDQSNG